MVEKEGISQKNAQMVEKEGISQKKCSNGGKGGNFTKNDKNDIK